MNLAEPFYAYSHFHKNHGLVKLFRDTYIFKLLHFGLNKFLED